MNLWQPKMRMEETDEEYSARVYNTIGRKTGRRYATPEIIRWIHENKISIERDYEDSSDIKFVFQKSDEAIVFRLKFG